MKLAGKVLVITGSGGALGQATAATLRGCGATLALIDHAAAPAAQAAGTVHYGGIDLTREDAARSVMERVVKDAGRLDGLINIAGGCCGNTPEHIAAIAKALEGRTPRKWRNAADEREKAA